MVRGPLRPLSETLEHLPGISAQGLGVTVLMAALSTVTRLASNSHPQEFMWAVLGEGRRSILLLHLKKQNKQKRHSLNLGV